MKRHSFDPSEDQRVGRTRDEVEAERKRLSQVAKDRNQGYPAPETTEFLLNLGAWLALCWTLDDDDPKIPLQERLGNAAQCRRPMIQERLENAAK